MNATQEQWRPVVDWEGMYEVSDHGRVRSVDRVVSGVRGSRRLKGKVLKSAKTIQGGHHVVSLCRNSKPVQKLAHRLMLEAFVGPCPDGMEACHRDDNPDNNHLSNLRWDTHRANISESYRNGKVHFNTVKTHCKRGHELSGNNLIEYPGYRNCRTCRNEVEQRRRRPAPPLAVDAPL